jgi:hypothetical protein
LEGVASGRRTTRTTSRKIRRGWLRECGGITRGVAKGRNEGRAGAQRGKRRGAKGGAAREEGGTTGGTQHDEGLNIMINVAKGGPAGFVGCTTWPPPIGKEMRWAAYAFWKAAEANRAVRNGRRARADNLAAGPWQWGEGQWRQLNLLPLAKRILSNCT